MNSEKPGDVKTYKMRSRGDEEIERRVRKEHFRLDSFRDALSLNFKSPEGRRYREMIPFSITDHEFLLSRDYRLIRKKSLYSLHVKY